MSFRLARLRFRRIFKRRGRQLREAGAQADQHISRHFFRRLHHLIAVKRFLALWLIPMLALIGLGGWQAMAISSYYQHEVPASGGIYREGIIGQFTNANPIFATSDVDKSVSRLIFAGLFKYNYKNQLVGDLAKSYKVSNNGETYTVQLRPGLTWQDGAPLKADDVAFTYHAIQNPMTQSPYYANWNDVNVSTAGPLTVVFKLPNPLASFKYSLTNGIVPKHLLGRIAPDKLRSADFNTEDPIGAGPFAWQELSVEGDEPSVRQELIALSPFADYHGGAAKLGGLVIHAYPTAQLAESGLLNQDIDGLSGLNTVPDNFRQKGVTIYSLPQTAETMVFFKETNPVLGDAKVRQALILAADRQQIINNLPYAVTAEEEPLLPGQLGYDSKYKQPDYDLAAARQLLASDGWVAGKDGILQKGAMKLSFNLYSSDSQPYGTIARAIARQWQKLGVEANVYLEDQNDFQNSLSSHSYDAVLTTIALGVDPDEYIYWDSSQADVRSASRLNLSEVKVTDIDMPLEAGRTRDDPQIRAIKYHNFLAAWLSNEPALVLFQPRFLYFTNVSHIYNFSAGYPINDAIGRYNNVANWEIRQTAVTD